MQELLGYLWRIILAIYSTVYVNGFAGCLVSLLLGMFLSNRGVSLTGQSEGFTGRIFGDNVTLTKRPEIQGSRTWVGRLFGVILKLAGTLLILIALFAFVNVVLR